MTQMATCARWLLLRLALACFLFLGCSAGLIQTAHSQEPGHPDSPAEHEHKSGEVKIFAPALELGIWTLVVFLGLLFVLRKYAWGPMLEGLHKREESIRGAIAEAQKTRTDVERLQEQWNQKMSKANQEVANILENARGQGKTLTDEMVNKARSEIQSERDRLRREIETARDQALQELWKYTAQLATLISSKAIRRQLTLDPEEQRRLVDEALAELRNAGSERQRQVASVRA